MIVMLIPPSSFSRWGANVSQEESPHFRAGRHQYNLIMNQDGVPNYAQALVQASSPQAVQRLLSPIQRELDREFPHAQALVRELQQGPPTYAPVEIRLYGPDLHTLKTLGEQARLLLARIPEITHSRASLAGGEPKLWLDADEDELRAAGFSLVELAADLDGKLEGSFGGSIIEPSEELPVRVRGDGAQRADLTALASLDVLTPRSDGPVDSLPLAALGELELTPAPDSILRRDGERVNIISGYTAAGALPATAVAQFQKFWQAADIELPPSYSLEFGGDAEARSDAIANLLSPMGLIVTLMLATIVLTFNSFRLAGVVLIVAGQAMGLGLLSLTLFRYPFGFQPIIGLIGLTGVAINAAIIILAALQADPRAQAGELGAIRDTVLAASRHIISTTITTFGGFLPLMLAEGGFWPPFATAIAGGVVLSTIVSFYFTPPAFLLLTRRQTRTTLTTAATAGA